MRPIHHRRPEEPNEAPALLPGEKEELQRALRPSYRDDIGPEQEWAYNIAFRARRLLGRGNPQPD